MYFQSHSSLHYQCYLIIMTSLSPKNVYISSVCCTSNTSLSLNGKIYDMRNCFFPHYVSVQTDLYAQNISNHQTTHTNTHSASSGEHIIFWHRFFSFIYLMSGATVAAALGSEFQQKRRFVQNKSYCIRISIGCRSSCSMFT